MIVLNDSYNPNCLGKCYFGNGGYQLNVGYKKLTRFTSTSLLDPWEIGAGKGNFFFPFVNAKLVIPD